MPQSVRERIYQALRDEIMYGQLFPGERVVEKDFTEKFKTSRSTIRECLRQLESEGLMEFQANKGFRVSKLSTQQVDEIYSLRMILESYATRLTAQKATPQQIDYLEKTQQGCREAVAQSDLKAWIDFNTEFHQFFYKNCGNGNLKILLDTLKRRIYRYQYIITSIPGHFDDYLAIHEKIIEACRYNDGSAAEEHMKTHLNYIKELILAHLSKFPAMKIG